MTTPQRAAPETIEQYPIWRQSELLVAVVVDGPPVPKARARVVNGHTYTPERTAGYEALVAWTVREKFPDLTPDGEHEYRIHLTFYLPTHRRADYDNLSKGATDALTGIVWRDDSQIADARVQLMRGCSHPRAEILIWRLI